MVRQYWKINEKLTSIFVGLEPSIERFNNFPGRGAQVIKVLSYSHLCPST
jgi:hypothetical protein